VTYRYFAYGPTLETGHVAEWLQETGETVDLTDGSPAILDDWALTLATPSRLWMGAIGSIAESPGAMVYGVLFELADEQADAIRRKEGVAAGLFREIDVEVRLWAPGMGEGEDGPTIQLLPARAFAAVPRPLTPTAPSRRWVDLTVRGAQARGLPDLWVAELRRHGRT
jgi:hypothetical protein